MAFLLPCCLCLQFIPTQHAGGLSLPHLQTPCKPCLWRTPENRLLNYRCKRPLEILDVQRQLIPLLQSLLSRPYPQTFLMPAISNTSPGNRESSQALPYRKKKSPLISGLAPRSGHIIIPITDHQRNFPSLTRRPI